MKILLTTRERFADGLFIYSRIIIVKKKGSIYDYESGTYVKNVPFIDVVKGEKVI